MTTSPKKAPNGNRRGADVDGEEIETHGGGETASTQSSDGHGVSGSNGATSTEINNHPNPKTAHNGGDGDGGVLGTQEGGQTASTQSSDRHGDDRGNGATIVEGSTHPTDDSMFGTLGPTDDSMFGTLGPTDDSLFGTYPTDNSMFGILGPGAHFIQGPDWRGDSEGSDIETAAQYASDDEQVFEGYLPEPSAEDIARQQALQLVQSAITLDESAVKAIVDGEPAAITNEIATTEDGEPVSKTAIDLTQNGDDLEANQDTKTKQGGGKGTLERCVKSPLTIVFLTLTFLSGIALGVALAGSTPQDNGSLSSSQNIDPSSCVGRFQERYARATEILAAITPLQVLKNTSTPQNKAAEWIVCEDEISSRLIDSAEAGVLPKQSHGAKGGDSGEAQVLRRYALAVFYFATSEAEEGWAENWNFLSGNKHECAWHQNKTRGNFPFGDLDPAGLVCLTEGVQGDSSRHGWRLLDDVGMEISDMMMNFRVSNDLVGTIPPELGYITSMTNVMLENQDGLYGEIPSTIGNMSHLGVFSVLFAGPNFGGVIPPSLFTIPTLKHITLSFNEGVWRFPPSIESGENGIVSISMQSCGVEGTIPSFISEFTRIENFDLSGNSLEGSIPNSIGGLTSLEYLNVRENKLNGTLPQSLQQLSNLTAMVLGKNQIQGTLPSWMGNMSKLRLLDLSYNELKGGVPATFSQLQELEHISLQHNANLNGSIDAFGTLGKLTSLLLYSNKFSSTIPPGLFSTFKNGYIYADFGHNNFTGQLPQSFRQHATNITYLATMKNNFDDDVVDDEICEQVPALYADCSSCPCCKTCCDADSVTGNDALCEFNLDVVIRVSKKPHHKHQLSMKQNGLSLGGFRFLADKIVFLQ